MGRSTKWKIDVTQSPQLLKEFSRGGGGGGGEGRARASQFHKIHMKGLTTHVYKEGHRTQ